MAGNVWEWCQDWYDGNHDTRVLRGGSWLFNSNFLRVATRNNDLPSYSTYYYGFRCVVDVPENQKGSKVKL